MRAALRGEDRRRSPVSRSRAREGGRRRPGGEGSAVARLAVLPRWCARAGQPWWRGALAAGASPAGARHARQQRARGGTPVPEAVARLGLRAADRARGLLGRWRRQASPTWRFGGPSAETCRLLALRRLLGLRSPLNRWRAADLFDAKASGWRLPAALTWRCTRGRRHGSASLRLLVLKCGGEAERNRQAGRRAPAPAGRAAASWRCRRSRPAAGEAAADLRRVWEGAAGDGPEEGTVVARVASGCWH